MSDFFWDNESEDEEYDDEPECDQALLDAVSAGDVEPFRALARQAAAGTAAKDDLAAVSALMVIAVGKCNRVLEALLRVPLAISPSRDELLAHRQR